MKRMTKTLVNAAAICSLCVPLALAQPPEGGPRGPRGFRPGDGGPPRMGQQGPEMMLRALPLFAALDSNRDGKISSDEIENAAAALKTLDKNGDGTLDLEELRPRMPGFGRRGMPDGDRGPAGRFGGDRPSRPEGAPDRPRDFGPRGRPGADRAEEGRPRGNVAGMLSRLMQLDRNGDGKLERDELPENAQRIMDAADKNNDGYLTKEEIEQAQREFAGRGRPQGGPEGNAEGRARQLFERLDKNGDGKLSKDEAPERISDRFDQVDTNGDGVIDPEEFGQAMMRRTGARQGPPVQRP